MTKACSHLILWNDVKHSFQGICERIETMSSQMELQRSTVSLLSKLHHSKRIIQTGVGEPEAYRRAAIAIRWTATADSSCTMRIYEDLWGKWSMAGLESMAALWANGPTGLVIITLLGTALEPRLEAAGNIEKLRSLFWFEDRHVKHAPYHPISYHIIPYHIISYHNNKTYHNMS